MRCALTSALVAPHRRENALARGGVTQDEGSASFAAERESSKVGVLKSCGHFRLRTHVQPCFPHGYMSGRAFSGQRLVV